MNSPGADESGDNAVSMIELGRSIGQVGLRKIAQFEVFQREKTTPKEHRSDLVAERDKYKQYSIEYYGAILAAIERVEDVDVAFKAYGALSSLVQSLLGMMIAVPPRNLRDLLDEQNLADKNKKTLEANRARLEIIRGKVGDAIACNNSHNSKSLAGFLKDDPEIIAFNLKEESLRKIIGQIRRPKKVPGES
jgi:hypothetical protein